MMYYRPNYIVWILLMALAGCRNHTTEKTPLFQVRTASQTGLNFANRLSPSDQFNVFHYMYFYNGAGIGAADFNNDGQTDLFFAASQSGNRLFLNKGALQFTDVTEKAHIPQDAAWSTGVSVVDLNNDGLLDIYICRVGKYEVLNSSNQLLICKGIDADGIPFYEEAAAKYGLNFSGFSTQAAFFDYDGDGDLDMYLLNHSIHQNGTFGPRNTLIHHAHPLSGDRLYRNDHDHFTDVTQQAGINSSVIGYGLGIAIADINLDGYPDIYIGNDFHENDYLYINQRNGSFKEECTSRTMHTSMYSMGVDVADVNNDAQPEIISMDMLPSDPYILKRSEGEDQYDVFKLKINNGYGYQYTRNNLQLNRGNGLFSEVGLYAGVAATDWSWAPLWMDFDNDGNKDLFISNGIPKRLNDIDYINYVSNDEVQSKIRNNNLDSKDMALIDKFPQIKIPNRFFHNNGNLVFQDMGENVLPNTSTFSNGAIYADLDNDGDLDIVVNNIDEPALLYENRSCNPVKKPFIELKLKGPAVNRNAIGARVVIFAGGSTRTYEKYPVHGFLSSMEIPLHIGLDKSNIDSMLLIWPDNSYQRINWQKDTSSIAAITYTTGLPLFPYRLLTPTRDAAGISAADITRQANLLYRHQENPFVEFDREPLIPHMVSTEGPALAVGDINGDGLEDVFIGASKGNRPAVFIQQASGQFTRMPQPALDLDSSYEAVDACWVDVNNDHSNDLVIAGGGNEYYGTDSNLLPRVYLNDGKGKLTPGKDAFSGLYLTASCVAPADINGDGFTDLFIGGRAVPFNYGATPSSYLLLNNGKGQFKEVTAAYAPQLSAAGMVTGAVWTDLDKDGNKDLVICLEWGGIDAFMYKGGRLVKKILTTKKGWWNFLLPCDVNNDGNIDFVAGNLGLNSRLKASEQYPVKLYFNDFDDNGTKEQLLTYYLDGKELPFANKDELQKRMPLLKKKFLYAEDFAKASLKELFTPEKLSGAQVLSANYFANAVLLNDGKTNFSVLPLPWQAQLTTYRDAAIVDANGDKLPDIMLGGNFYDNNIQMGRYDADYGSILLNKGSGRFIAESLGGLPVKGQLRHIRPIQIKGKQAYLLARNNDSALVIRLSPAR